MSRTDETRPAQCCREGAAGSRWPCCVRGGLSWAGTWSFRPHTLLLRKPVLCADRRSEVRGRSRSCGARRLGSGSRPTSVNTRHMRKEDDSATREGLSLTTSSRGPSSLPAVGKVLAGPQLSVPRWSWLRRVTAGVPGVASVWRWQPCRRLDLQLG